MILKKPYAFLIKHFRFINLLLSALTSFMFYKTYQVLNFFNQYIHNNYMGSYNTGFYQNYISFSLYLVLFLIIMGIAAILLLLVYKKKPVKIYMGGLGYYIVLFILFIVAKNTMVTLETETIGVNLARGLRDVLIISMIPQLPFIINFVIRGLGFNIYKFNFSEDLKDLEINNLDNEEVEVAIRGDGTALKRTIRRFFREFKYYLKENKFMIVLIMVIGIIALIYVFYNKSKTYNYDITYNEGISFNSQGLDYTILASLVTNMDYNGKFFNDDGYYAVIKLKIENHNKDDASFDYKKFRLEINDELIYPTQDLSNYFIDFAPAYTSSMVRKNSANEMALVYKIKQEQVNSKMRIKIENGYVIQNGKTSGKYIYIKLNPKISTILQTKGEYNLNDVIMFNDTYLNATNIKLSNMINTKAYMYDYDSCNDTLCGTFKDKLTINYIKNKTTMLIFDCEYTIDATAAYYKFGQNINRFLENFVAIKYLQNGEFVYEDVKDITPNNLKGKIALEVTNKVDTAKEAYLAFIIRDKEYLLKII